jgi:hypothetical protein
MKTVSPKGDNWQRRDGGGGAHDAEDDASTTPRTMNAERVAAAVAAMGDAELGRMRGGDDDTGEASTSGAGGGGGELESELHVPSSPSQSRRPSRTPSRTSAAAASRSASAMGGAAADATATTATSPGDSNNNGGGGGGGGGKTTPRHSAASASGKPPAPTREVPLRRRKPLPPKEMGPGWCKSVNTRVPPELLPVVKSNKSIKNKVVWWGAVYKAEVCAARQTHVNHTLSHATRLSS